MTLSTIISFHNEEHLQIFNHLLHYQQQLKISKAALCNRTQQCDKGCMTTTYVQERQNRWCSNQIPLHSISGGKI